LTDMLFLIYAFYFWENVFKFPSLWFGIYCQLGQVV
jgi:hypothetical protein